MTIDLHLLTKDQLEQQVRDTVREVSVNALVARVKYEVPALVALATDEMIIKMVGQENIEKMVGLVSGLVDGTKGRKLLKQLLSEANALYDRKYSPHN